MRKHVSSCPQSRKFRACVCKSLICSRASSVFQFVWQFVLGHAPQFATASDFATAYRCREMYLRRSQAPMLGSVRTFDSQQALRHLFIYLCQVLQRDFVFRIHLCTQTSADRPSEPVLSSANVVSSTAFHCRNPFATVSNTIGERAQSQLTTQIPHPREPYARIVRKYVKGGNHTCGEIGNSACVGPD